MSSRRFWAKASVSDGGRSAYALLTRALVALHGQDSALARAVGRDFKGKLSLLLYVLAIAVAFREPLAACILYGVVAVIRLVPDRRIITTLAAPGATQRRGASEERSEGNDLR